MWPSLEDDFVGFTTPQYFALDWLANNANYDDYSQDQKVQRFALATLFFTTSGDGWRNSSLWLSDKDECFWYSGSAESPCDESGSYILLDLDLNNLSGSIPAELALLSNLTGIDFSKAGSSASLSSTIPSEIGLLANLTSLNLRGNDLSGSIPSDVGNCISLQTLELGKNRFSGGVPTELGALTQLKYLNLERNDMTGLLPSTFGSLTKLEKLHLANNRLSGGIPTEIGRLVLVNSIDLDGNSFSSLPTEIGNLRLLQRFSAANNLLQGPLPSQIGGLIELVSLQLENNSLTGTIPRELGNLIELRDTLNLSSNQFRGQLAPELGRLIFLRNMELYGNQLTGGIPTSFSALRRVGVLRLESNNLTGIVSDLVCAVFEQTYPVFVTDCANPAEITCACCMFCCEDNGDCTCQFANTDLDFLCSDFSRSPGLAERVTVLTRK